MHGVSLDHRIESLFYGLEGIVSNFVAILDMAYVAWINILNRLSKRFLRLHPRHYIYFRGNVEIAYTITLTLLLSHFPNTNAPRKIVMDSSVPEEVHPEDSVSQQAQSMFEFEDDDIYGHQGTFAPPHFESQVASPCPPAIGNFNFHVRSSLLLINDDDANSTINDAFSILRVYP